MRKSSSLSRERAPALEKQKEDEKKQENQRRRFVSKVSFPFLSAPFSDQKETKAFVRPQRHTHRAKKNYVFRRDFFFFFFFFCEKVDLKDNNAVF